MQNNKKTAKLSKLSFKGNSKCEINFLCVYIYKDEHVSQPSNFVLLLQDKFHSTID